MFLLAFKGTLLSNNLVNIDRWVQGQKQPPEVFCKKSCYQNFGKIHREAPLPEFLFNKVVGLSRAQVFPCEFSQISKNTIFTEHLCATTSRREILSKITKVTNSEIFLKKVAFLKKTLILGKRTFL